MEVTGRIAGDAQVKKLKDNRELVTFTVALNDRYKTKAGEQRGEATFISCSYWVSTKIASILKKGSIVTVNGHIGINAYKASDGEFHANLTFHCNYVKLIASGKNAAAPANDAVAADTQDLPF